MIRKHRRFILGSILVTVVLTACTGTTKKLPAAERTKTSTIGSTVATLETTTPAVQAATSTSSTKDPTIREVIGTSIAPLDPAKNGSALFVFDGDAKSVVAAGIALENSVGFNTVWQGTSLKTLAPTRMGDDDFDIDDIVQTPGGSLITGTVKSGTLGLVKLVSSTGTVEVVNVVTQLGDGRFTRLYDTDPALGVMAIWNQKDSDSVVWSADGRTWKKLEFIDVTSFKTLHIISADNEFLAVGTSPGSPKPIVKSFTFTANGIGTDLSGLSPKTLRNEFLGNGPGGPLFSAGGGAEGIEIWRFTNSAWSNPKASFRNGSGDVKSRTLEQLVATSNGWYALGWAWDFRQVWHSVDGVAWKTVGAPGSAGIREDSHVTLFDSPDGPILAIDQTWFAIADNELIKVIDDARISSPLDDGFAITRANREWNVAVSRRSGSNTNDRRTDIYALEQTGVKSTSVQNFPATQVPYQDSVDGSSFVLAELLGPGTNPKAAKSDGTFVAVHDSKTSAWSRVESPAAFNPASGRLSEVYGAATPTFRFMFAWVERNGKGAWEMVVRPHNRPAIRVQSTLAKQGTFSFAKFNDNVILIAAAKDTVIVETYSDEGLVSTQTLSAPGVNGVIPTSAYHVDRSEIIVGPKSRTAFTQLGPDLIAAKESKWVRADEELPAKAHWSSRTQDVDAVTRPAPGGLRSIELYVNGVSTGTFPLSVAGWTDTYEIELLDVTATELRFVATHDAVISIISAPTPTSLALALGKATPRT
jgi:hypothetical protein